MTRFNQMHPAQQAGILCNDPQFQQFAATRSGLPGTQFCASAAAQYLREACKIASRRELNTNAVAHSNFAALRTSFDAWLGVSQPQITESKPCPIIPLQTPKDTKRPSRQAAKRKPPT